MLVGGHLLVAEPECDDGDVDAGVSAAAWRRCVSGCAWWTCLVRRRRAAGARGGEMDGEAVLDGIVAEPCPGACREQRVMGLTRVLGEPGPQDGDGESGERRGPLLAALARCNGRAPRRRERRRRGTGRSARRSAARSGRRARAGRGRAGRSSVPRSGAASRASTSGAVSQVSSVRSSALGRDGQDPLDDGGVLGVAQRGVAEQRVDRGEPAVAGAHACCRRSASRWSRKAATSGASRSAMSSAEGVLPVLAQAKPSSSRKRVPVTGDGVARWPGAEP